VGKLSPSFQPEFGLRGYSLTKHSLIKSVTSSNPPSLQLCDESKMLKITLFCAERLFNIVSSLPIKQFTNNPIRLRLPSSCSAELLLTNSLTKLLTKLSGRTANKTSYRWFPEVTYLGLTFTTSIHRSAVESHSCLLCRRCIKIGSTP